MNSPNDLLAQLDATIASRVDAALEAHDRGENGYLVTRGYMTERIIEVTLAAADAVDPYRAALKAVLELHADVGDSWCSICRLTWPCPTVRVVAEQMEGQ